MAKKKEKFIENEFNYEEDIDLYEFSETPFISGTCIASFSFDAPCTSDDLTINNPMPSNNRITPIPNGATPPIDGEDANIKRSYTLRASTIRKINKLKSIHPDIKVCVSSIVDIAIDFYHNHIINEGGTQ